jgi:hypothetical protein
MVDDEGQTTMAGQLSCTPLSFSFFSVRGKEHENFNRIRSSVAVTRWPANGGNLTLASYNLNALPFFWSEDNTTSSLEIIVWHYEAPHRRECTDLRGVVNLQIVAVGKSSSEQYQTGLLLQPRSVGLTTMKPAYPRTRMSVSRTVRRSSTITTTTVGFVGRGRSC